MSNPVVGEVFTDNDDDGDTNADNDANANDDGQNMIGNDSG